TYLYIARLPLDEGRDFHPQCFFITWPSCLKSSFLSAWQARWWWPSWPSSAISTSSWKKTNLSRQAQPEIWIHTLAFQISPSRGDPASSCSLRLLGSRRSFRG